MKFKSLLLGSAAILAAGTGAQAADLPTAEPVEYVRICDAFGTGFYYIPGTDTCLRVGGQVRVEAAYVWEDEDLVNSEFDNWTTRARGNVFLDARTQTDMGMIRAYINFEGNVGHDNEITEPATPNYEGNGVGMPNAFIQITNSWGTFTAGRSGSFFDVTQSHGFNSRVGIDDSTTSQTLFGYTFGGGNGFSASIAIEDPKSSFRRINGDDDYEGQETPDVVGNIKITQGWGTAQVMGMVGRIHDVNGDGTRWAVGAGVNGDLPFFGLGFHAMAGYAEGALGYITSDPGGIGDFEGPDGEDTNNGWTIKGGLDADFTPKLMVFVDGAYTSIDEEGDDPGDDDYDFWAVVVGARWEPSPGLTMGPVVAYESIDADGADEANTWGALWRIQRAF